MFQSEFIFMVLLVVWSSLVQISNKAILLDLKALPEELSSLTLVVC